MPDSAVITIDGPGGSGKGTIACAVARKLGWHFLDSGALYRLVGLVVLERQLSLDDEENLGRLASDLEIAFELRRDGSIRILLEGLDAGNRIRRPEVSSITSKIAAIPAVRAGLLDRQRQFRKPPGLVADGRDMGTVVFPDAELKIFLTASAEERASRRYKQLKEKGENVNLSRLFQEIQDRDERDQNRSIAPLRPASDAIVVDSTDLSIDSVLDRVLDLARKQGLGT